tara:strand:+ start:2190 stop:3215 length:1026 start_codon:yes stop_codon:yes gene_type:complete
MIKVKILNPFLGRNEPTFRPLFQIKNMLRDYSIDITDSDDYDFLFVGMNDFIDKKKSLEESVEYGLENLSKVTGDYFLFDGSDSTSLMGAYEVFEQSNALHLFKNQMFHTREEYKTPYAFNKYFFGSGSDLDLSYDISEEQWKKIKLTGWNFISLLNYTDKFHPISSNKEFDICAMFYSNHKYNEDHLVRNDEFYNNHRGLVLEKLNTMQNKYKIASGKKPFNEYINILANSKLLISPFGMGEIGQKDWESIITGAIIIKPDMSKINTKPNIFLDNDTYLSVNYNWTDLEEKIDYALTNFTELNETINQNIRKKYVNEYSHNNLCLHWYNIFKDLEGIGEE